MTTKPSLRIFARTYEDDFIKGFAPTSDPDFDVAIVESLEYQTCDIAVMFGFEKARFSERFDLISHIHKTHKGHKIVIESGFFGRRQIPRPKRKLLKRLFRPKPSGSLVRAYLPYFRVGLDGAFAFDGNFLNKNSAADRWEALQNELGLSLKPYRTDGAHILIALQIPNDASLFGLNVADWLVETTTKLKSLTNRPIKVRSHPNMPFKHVDEMKARTRAQKVEFLPVEFRDISNDLENCWACVTYSSSSSVDALVNGVPPICLSPANIAYPVSSKTLEEIESPLLPDREPFMRDLAYAQWSREEIGSGKVWPRFRQALLDMYH